MTETLFQQIFVWLSTAWNCVIDIFENFYTGVWLGFFLLIIFLALVYNHILISFTMGSDSVTASGDTDTETDSWSKYSGSGKRRSGNSYRNTKTSSHPDSVRTSKHKGSRITFR